MFVAAVAAAAAAAAISNTQGQATPTLQHDQKHQSVGLDLIIMISNIIIIVVPIAASIHHYQHRLPHQHRRDKTRPPFKATRIARIA